MLFALLKLVRAMVTLSVFGERIVSYSSLWKWRIRLALFRFGLLSGFEIGREFIRLLIRKPHERDFQVFRMLLAQNGVFVDVGANIGQSALAFRIVQPKYRVHSFEPNPAHYRKLEAVQRISGRGKMVVHTVGLGSKAETVPFYLPRVKGVPFTQEATIDIEMLRTEETLLRFHSVTGTRVMEVESTSIRLERFDDTFAYIEPDVVKIDVQGAELKVLLGMERTLRSCRPLLLIESNTSEENASMSMYLQGLGYCGPYVFDGVKLVRSSVARDGSNVFWVHPSRPRLEAGVFGTSIEPGSGGQS